MNCKVQGVYQNVRYRIMIVDEESYILDMGRPFWKMFFPFFYWILPNVAYRVNDPEIIEKIKTPEIKQDKTAWEGVIAGAIGVFLANLLKPLVNYFNVESTQLVNSIIILIVFSLVLSVFFYINIRSEKRMAQVVDLKQYTTIRLWIRPQSYRHFLFISFFYLFFIGFAILSWRGFIQIANGVILIAGMICFFIAILFSVLAIALGDNKVRIKNNKSIM